MIAWMVAGLAWTMAATSLPVLRQNIPENIVRVVTGAALFGFVFLCLRWWQGGFSPEAWNDRAFMVQMLGLAADGCIRAAARRSGGEASVA